MDSEKSFQRVYNRIIVYVIGIPVAFLIIFIVVSVNQLREINSQMYEVQSQAVKEIMARFMNDQIHNEKFQQFMILATLEEESLIERYNQGH